MHVPGQDRYGLCVVYLTDSKQHPRPDAAAVEAKAAEETEAREQAADAKMRRELARMKAAEARRDPEQEAKDAEFRALKDAVRSGNVPRVEVVHSPGFYPTPAELAARVVELADVRAGMRVLEPSAGAGAIADALPQGCALVCVELHPKLVAELDRKGHRTVQGDFLAMDPESFGGGFDRIVMNPPFDGGADMRHIEHARKFLKPGGRLVAICANGPRQHAKLRTMAEDLGGEWFDLPAGSFESVGTSVSTALLWFDEPIPEPVREPVRAAVQVGLFG
jgi:predicted RNA methylase